MILCCQDIRYPKCHMFCPYEKSLYENSTQNWRTVIKVTRFKVQNSSFMSNLEHLWIHEVL